jgi:dihydrodipicolinate synthase/N-acetylneuraminate lyase
MAHFAGVHVATTTPFTADGAVDLDVYREHCRWLVEHGIAGIVPGGSLGEYESLTSDERRSLVEAAVEAVDGRAIVVPGVSAAGAHQSLEHARHARDVGAAGVMALPPVIHPPTPGELVDHFATIATAGLPIIVYNNPFSTKKDLLPPVLAELATIDEVVAVKEFSGDVRRVSHLLELTDDLEVLCGADDLALESAAMGAVGWIGGFTGVVPRATVELFELGRASRLADALPAYRALLPLLRWDTGPRFVQAIKLAQTLVGQPVGGTRPPRLALEDAEVELVTAQLEHALDVLGDDG